MPTAQARRRPLDYYMVLGVSLSATAAEIKRAWRRAAFASHPDRFPDPAAGVRAAERFRVVSEAYRVLADPARRRAYDVTRAASAGIPRGTDRRSRVGTRDDLDGFLRASDPLARWLGRFLVVRLVRLF